MYIGLFASALCPLLWLLTVSAVQVIPSLQPAESSRSAIRTSYRTYSSQVTDNRGEHSLQLRPRQADLRKETDLWATQIVGGQHGTAFTDVGFVCGGSHRRISYVTLAGCGLGEHVTAMKLGFRDNHSADPAETTNPLTITHGQYFGDAPETTLYLAQNEYITEMQLTTWQKKVNGGLFATWHTRIGWIEIWTSGKQHIQCGSYSDTDPSYDFFKKGHALLFFSGSAGDAIDNLQAYYIPVADF